MDDATRVLVELARAVAAGGGDARDAALDAAAARADPVEVEEALLQSYLFLGYPAALNAIAAWRRRSGREAPAASRDDPAEWTARGQRVCERVYAGQYERLRANVAALHPDMERWMVREGYGKVLGRDGLSLQKREMCIVAMLAAQDAEPQLYAHLRGALNAGASTDDIAAVVALLEPTLGPEHAARLRATWAAVHARRDATVPGEAAGGDSR